jgi:hypothetical protein
MRHHLPAPEVQPITESPTMRSFVVNCITIPVGFKAIRCKRGAQLWNRQASIIIDLTIVALRRGWQLPSARMTTEDVLRALGRYRLS